jgi:hypothetical protein
MADNAFLSWRRLNQPYPYVGDERLDLINSKRLTPLSDGLVGMLLGDDVE